MKTGYDPVLLYLTRGEQKAVEICYIPVEVPTVKGELFEMVNVQGQNHVLSASQSISTNEISLFFNNSYH